MLISVNTTFPNQTMRDRSPCPIPIRLSRLVLALAIPYAGAALAESVPPDLTAVPFEQLLSMEVFSASRFAQKASEAPSSVTVVTAADIKSFGWRTLADVMRSVRGLYVSEDRNYTYAGARGMQRAGDYNTRFLLLVDGSRINDAVYDQAPVGGEFPLELDLIERIEFVPGPGSSVYGSNALFGVINVITRKSAAAPDGRLAIEAGSFGTRKASVRSAFRSAGGVDLVFGASRYLSEGQDLYFAEFDTPQDNHGVAAGLDWEHRTRAYASAGAGPFSLSLMHARRVKGIPTASFNQPFNTPGSYTIDQQSYASLTYGEALGAHETVDARLLAGRYESRGDYLYQDGSVNVDGSKAAWWSGEVNVVSTRWPGHKVVAGLDLENNYRLLQFTFDKSPPATILDDRRSARRAGLYIQDEIALAPSRRASLGLRHDRVTGLDGVSSPRAALILQCGEQTTLKLVHGAAFRAPNSYEKYYAYPGPGGQIANPLLRKERVASSELVLVRQLGGDARLTATVFHISASSLVTLQEEAGTGTTRFENAAGLHSRGAELEYERRWRSGALLRASYSQASVHAGATDGGAPQTSAPAHLAKLNLALPLGAGWRSGFEGQFVGRRHGPAGPVDGYWLANLNLVSGRLAGASEVSLGVYNLFDRAYADPAAPEHRQRSIPQDGRSVRVRLAHAF